MLYSVLFGYIQCSLICLNSVMYIINCKSVHFLIHLKGIYLYRSSSTLWLLAQTVFALCYPLVAQTLHHKICTPGSIKSSSLMMKRLMEWGKTVQKWESAWKLSFQQLTVINTAIMTLNMLALSYLLDNQTNNKGQDTFNWPDQRNHVNVIFDILWESE